MNQKTLQVLSILINSPGRNFSYEELAKRLSVSVRSARNYILAIQEYLEERETDRPLLSIICSGAAFTGCASEGRKIYLSLLEDGFYTYRLSPRERVWLIILLLLLSDTFLKLSDLSERFHASRATVLKDMEQVKEFLKREGLCLSPLFNKGYLLTAGELQRRRLIEKLLNGLSKEGLRHPTNFYYKFLLAEGRLKEEELVNRLLHAEEAYRLNVSDACFDELLLFLTIMAARLKSGNGVAGGLPEFKEDGPGKLAAEIAKALLEGLFNASPPTGGHEIRLLAEKLLSLRFLPSAVGSSGNGPQLHIGLSYFLSAVSRELSVPFYKDREMIEMLEAHLDSMSKLRRGRGPMENGYALRIISEYPEYYEAVKRHRLILKNISGYDYRDEDLVFIVMYLLVAADKYFTDEVIPRVIICCHTGRGTANFLAKQLKERFNVKIVGVTSNHRLPELLKMLECDAVISTLSLEAGSRSLMKVSPVLTDKDIMELTNRFAAITKEKGYGRIQKSVGNLYAGRLLAVQTVLDGKLTGLGENGILLDYACKSPEEAIRLSAKPLMENGCIRPRYVEAILDFYHENGAYFVYCPHVALAHAGPEDGANAFGFSILRLKTDIFFHRKAFDPVRYVICMSLTDRQNHTEEVLNIMTLFSIPENLNALNSFNTAKEVYRFLQMGGSQ